MRPIGSGEAVGDSAAYWVRDFSRSSLEVGADKFSNLSVAGIKNVDGVGVIFKTEKSRLRVKLFGGRALEKQGPFSKRIHLLGLASFGGKIG